jgi:hypothetical protein
VQQGRAVDGGRPLRIALLSYRSKPHSGGQGIYVRHLSRELVALGHDVEVLSGPPYPELDVLPDGRSPSLTRVESLDLYREPDPFRVPHWREFRSGVDVLEFALMCTAAFPEPLTFSLRAAKELRGRAVRPDVVHDNQTLGHGLRLLQRSGFRVLATLHHPITVDRRHDLAAAEGFRKRFSLRRWYSFLRMQGAVARRLPGLLTVSQSSADDIVRDFGVASTASRWCRWAWRPTSSCRRRCPGAGPDRGHCQRRRAAQGPGAAAGGGGQAAHRARRRARGRRPAQGGRRRPGGARPAGAAGRRALRLRRRRARARRAVRVGAGGRRAQPVRGLQPAGRGGDGVRDAARRHHRRGAAGGGGAARRDGAARAAR